MIIGHLGEQIKAYFGDGKKFGVDIDYITEDEPLGSAGSMYYLKDRIKDKYFILIFGDIFFDIDINKIEKFHIEKKPWQVYLCIQILILMTLI